MSCTINFKLVIQGFGMGGVISSYKPTTTLQPKVLGLVNGLFFSGGFSS